MQIGIGPLSPASICQHRRSLQMCLVRSWSFWAAFCKIRSNFSSALRQRFELTFSRIISSSISISSLLICWRWILRAACWHPCGRWAVATSWTPCCSEFFVLFDSASPIFQGTLEILGIFSFFSFSSFLSVLLIFWTRGHFVPGVLCGKQVVVQGAGKASRGNKLIGCDL